MKLSSLISEKKLVATWVKFQVINLWIMIDSSLDWVVSEILDANSHSVQKISDDLSWLAASQLLITVVKSSWDHVRVDVFSSASANHFIHSILNNTEFSSVEYHADIWVREVILLVSRASPRDLTEFAAFHISEQKGAASWGYQVSVLVDVDLLDFMTHVWLKNDSLTVFNSLDYDLRKRNIGELKLALVFGFL